MANVCQQRSLPAQSLLTCAYLSQDTRRLPKGRSLTEADAREIDDAQLLMCAEKEVGMLVDLYDIDNKISKETKEFFTKKGKMLAYTKAVAIVQKEKQDNLPGGFFSSFIKPIYPVRTFESKQLALTWLKTLKD